MQQMLHIFRKDFRYLRWEIKLMIALSFSLVWMSTRPPQEGVSPVAVEILLLATSGFIIARAVHGEPIPGDRQFWLTRPYDWRSLLGAKILFILTVVNLPIGLAQLSILLFAGFPVMAALPGLLWCQVLLFAGVAAPVTALAALTTGPVQFLFGSIALLIAGILSPALISRFNLLWISPVDWVRLGLVFAVAACAALVILFWQYKQRSTRRSRFAGIAALLAAIAIYAGLPLSSAFAIQSWFSRATLDPAALSVSLGKTSEGPVRWKRPAFVEVTLPLKISNLPEGLDVRIDALQVTMRGADGRVWRSPVPDSGAVHRAASDDAGSATYRAPLLVDRIFFERNRGEAVKLEATLHMTTLGNAQTKVVRAFSGQSDLIGGVQCDAGIANTVACRSAFRWPARIIEARAREGRGQTLTSFISYSPFPATLTLNPLEIRFASAMMPGFPQRHREVAIVSKEPLAHVRRELRIDDFRLWEYAFSAQLRP